MSWKPSKPAISDEKGKVILRRLLVAKQLYLHALEHSKHNSEIDKIIAVHNFHNAIEICLKSIVSYHEIPLSNPRDPGFEDLIREIDNSFKGKGIAVPYRQDIRTLNLARNMVQHHAHEPETKMIEEWKVITEKFLRASYSTYFDLDFDSLTQIEMIENAVIRRLLKLSHENLLQGKFKESAELTRFALDTVLEWSVKWMGFLEPLGMVSDSIAETDVYIYGALSGIAVSLDDVQKVVTLLAYDVSPVDYEKFIELTPQIHWNYEQNTAKASWYYQKPDNRETAEWIINYVIQAVLKVQSHKEITLSDQVRSFAEQVIETNGEILH